MEEQSGSLVRRTRFFNSVYHRFEASRPEYSIPFITFQPTTTSGPNPSSPDSATINSRTRPTHVTQAQQTVSPISVLNDSEEFNDAGTSIKTTRGLETPHSQRKEQKKAGYFGKLLHKHSHNIKTTTSDSKSLSHVSTFLKHVKRLIFRMPKSPAMEPR